MKAYKGFNKDMTCRGFQYEEGKEYQEDNAKLCECGFHACKNPIDCLAYYAPRRSVYHEVELDDLSDEVSKDSKICGKRIKIGARLSFVELVKRAVEYVKQLHGESVSTSKCFGSVSTSEDDYSTNISEGKYSANTSAGEYSVNISKGLCSMNTSARGYSVNIADGAYSAANTSVGDRSVNTSSGAYSVNTSEGAYSVNMSEGDRSVNTSSGSFSVNTSEGYRSVNTSAGYHSVNISAGSFSVNTSAGGIAMNIATGYGSANVSIGGGSRNKASAGSISVGWGRDNVCKGDIGSYMVLVERGVGHGDNYPQIGEPVLVKVDGEKVKADTWYKLIHGKLVEIEIMDDE